MTHIPAGARDIQIVERKKSADVLGVYVGLEARRACGFTQGEMCGLWVDGGHLTLQKRGGPGSQNSAWVSVSMHGVGVGAPREADLIPRCGKTSHSGQLDTRGPVTQVVSAPSPGGQAREKTGGAGGGISDPPVLPQGLRTESLGVRS